MPNVRSTSWSRIGVLLLGLLFQAVMPREGLSTVIYRASFSQYCSMATEIVDARVVEQIPVDTKSGFAHTRIRLELLQAFKGSNVEGLTVVVPGARLGERTVRVDGSPEFVNGEEVVLFLWKDSTEPAGAPRAILGLVDGTYRTVRDPGGEIHVRGLHATSGEKVADFGTRIRNEIAVQSKAKK